MEIVDYTTPEDSKAYRVKITVRNNLLLTAIEQAGYKSISSFARELGYQSTRLSELIGLKEPPIKKDGEFTEVAKKVMEALGAAPSDLWTVEQLNMRLEKNVWEDQYNTEMVRAILGSNVAQLEGAVYKDAEKPEDQMDKKDLNAALEKGLDDLTPREKKVLILRFGLDGCEEHTLEEAAQLMNVTRERVRQIEGKALREMRNPAISKFLKAHAEELLSGHEYPQPFWMENKKDDDDEKEQTNENR
jgi:RNA polymerase sigma factor (sigma-70 family)